jgi:hypothetical protein
MKIIEREPVGIIFRTFATEESQIKERVILVNQAIEKSLQLSFEEKPIFKFVDILVPSNPLFPSVDCGLMAERISSEWKHERRVRVHKTMGDIFCGTLNFGIGIQSESGIRYSLIASPDAHSYITKENVMGVLQQADSGAKIVGLAIHELRESIFQGKVANTFCLWHNRSLITVGGFNLLSAEPENEKRSHYLEGTDENGKPQYYKINGVEEVIPAALMVKTFKKCIAIVEPHGENQKYEVVSDPEIQKRHVAKISTKNIRQMELLSMIGLHQSILENGIVD